MTDTISRQHIPSVDDLLAAYDGTNIIDDDNSFTHTDSGSDNYDDSNDEDSGDEGGGDSESHASGEIHSEPDITTVPLTKGASPHALSAGKQTTSAAIGGFSAIRAAAQLAMSHGESDVLLAALTESSRLNTDNLRRSMPHVIPAPPPAVIVEELQDAENAAIPSDEDDCQDEDYNSDDCSDYSESLDEDDDNADDEEEDEFNANDATFMPNRSLQMASDPMNLEAMLQEYDEDSSDSGSSEYSGMESSCYSSEGSGSDFDDDDYDDLMANMPFHAGQGAQRLASGPSQTMVAQGGLSVCPAPISTQPGAPPSEGLDLTMLMNLRSELEKVGQMIIDNKQGEKFLQRAHILASINMLAANLPTCVVDHLGQEIRDWLATKDNKQQKLQNTEDGVDVVSMDCSDFDDDASDLSQGFMDETFEGLEPQDINKSFLRDSTRRNRQVRNIKSEEPRLEEGSSSETGTAGQSLHDALAVSAKPSAGKLDKFLKSRRGSCVGGTALFQSATSSVVSQDEELGLLPAVITYQGALLFVDISGFTKLSTVLDPEGLSKVINSYFQLIVDIVHDHAGDVQKFAGDAMFAEWRASKTTSIEECVKAASACATQLIQDCADFPVLSLVSAREVIGSGVTNLDIHCGLGVGNMIGLHVGDCRSRREYLYIGDTIDQATQACTKAKLGEAIASEAFYKILVAMVSPISNVTDESHIVAVKNSEIFEKSLLSKTRKSFRNAKSRGVTDQVDGLEAEALIEYRRLMSLYVHPVVVSNDIAAANNFQASKVVACSHERHREEAELRSVYVMFIKLLLPFDLRGNVTENGEAFHLLNDTMNLVTKKLKHYSGHLRQFIVDDKGFVMIATFGLRGSTFPNMVSERALPATLLIHQSLQMELGIESKIGATFGDVYCGAVGGEERHEYAVMGPSVNLAARLMHSPDNPGILVDNTVRQLTFRSYGFNAMPPIKAKGYAEPVPIFEPLSMSERTWGKHDPFFVGRSKEISCLLGVVDNMKSTPYPESKFLLITGEAGMGKTSVLVQAIEGVSKKFGRDNRDVLVLKHACLDSEMLIHFASFSQIFSAILMASATPQDDISLSSKGSTRTRSCASTALSSVASSVSTSRIIDAISQLGRELGAPSAIVSYATQYVLDSAEKVGQKKGPSKRALASFFAHGFLRCIEGSKAVVVAIDDIHRVDEISWTVLRKILENAGNVVLVGTSSLDKSTFRVDEAFMDDVENDWANSGRFIEMQLQALNRDEILSLTMKKLGLQTTEVTNDVLNEVVVQSGGMPHFASKVLENIKSRGQNPTTEKNKSVEEIILHRIDTLDLLVRGTLNIGAVLGICFTLGEVVSVLKENSDSKDDKDARQQALDSLKVAVNEGILVLTGETQDVSESFCFDKLDDTTSFSFVQEIWRDTLLGLMLASRKRDVHRKTANSLEECMPSNATLDYRMKILNHWMESGTTEKSTETALIVGELLQSSSRLPDTVSIYEDCLSMFGWFKESLRENYGFSQELLDLLPEGDIINIVKLVIALGKAHSVSRRVQDGTAMFETALHIMKNAKESSNVSDRSIAFPAFVGISDAIARGQIKQDVYCRYEQSMIHCFIQETRVHGRLIHHIQALYLQMVLFSRTGHNDKAIAVQSVIKEIYKPERHSKGLRNCYGMDSGALSLSLCAYLLMSQGDRRQALKLCRVVLKEIVPCIESDFDQAYMLVYPLLFVLKDAGFAGEAKQVFERVVIQPYGNTCSRAKYPFLQKTIEPLTMLLNLTSKQVSETDIEDISQWASDATHLMLGEEVNLCLGRMGRCGDSLSAELCLHLASRLPTTSDTRRTLVAYGSLVISNAITFNRRYGLKFAIRKAQEIQVQLKTLVCGIQRRSSAF